MLGLNRIQARGKVENVGSSRMMEKAGMTFEGVLSEYSFSTGRYLDLKMYSLLKKRVAALRSGRRTTRPPRSTRSGMGRVDKAFRHRYRAACMP